MTVENIRQACKITDQIFSSLVKNIKKFKTEKDVEQFILTEIKKRNLKPSFPPIVAAKRNASTPHHIPTNKKLEGFVVIDMGVRYKGYCSDMTRTLYFGHPNKKEVEIYNLLLHSQLKSIENLNKFKTYKELCEETRKILGKYNKYFIHSLGHGVGKKIHQLPKVSHKSKHKIKQGEVITIEPGIYVKNKYGIRIEDTLVVKKKPEILTKSTKDLIIIS